MMTTGASTATKCYEACSTPPLRERAPTVCQKGGAMADLGECEHCGGPMDAAGTRCPHCGAAQGARAFMRIIGAIAIAMAILWLLAFLGLISLPEEKE